MSLPQLMYRRFFIHFHGDVYAVGPTTKGYPWSEDDDKVREETVEQVKRDVCEQYDCDPEDFDVWPAAKWEYGTGVTNP